MVVEPALDNISNTGAVQQFPGYVSKIMVFQDNFNAAKQAANNLAAKVPSLALEFTPYRKVYRGRNLPQADIQAALKKVKEDQHVAYRPSDQVFVARMPNLGFSFADIQKQVNLKRLFHALPVETVCRQILKLLRVVKNLKDSEMVHADIRETNVMLNPYTGDMTIIDFDWLRTKGAYYAQYPQYFYCHPPEEAIYQSLKDGAWLRNPDREDAMRQAKAAVTATFTTQRRSLSWLTSAEKDHTLAILMAALENLYEFVHGPDPGTIEEAYAILFGLFSYPTIDLFGLGVSLLYLFRDYPQIRPSSYAIHRYIFNQVKNHWCDPNYATRMTIEKAIEDFEGMIRTSYPRIQLGDVPDVEEEFQRLAAMADFYEPSPVVVAPVAAAPMAAPPALAEVAHAIEVIVHAEEGGVPVTPPLPTPPSPNTPPPNTPPPNTPPPNTPPSPNTPPLPPSPTPDPSFVSAASSASSRWTNLSVSPERAGAIAPRLNGMPNVVVGGRKRRKTRKGRKSRKGSRRSPRR